MLNKKIIASTACVGFALSALVSASSASAEGEGVRHFVKISQEGMQGYDARMTLSSADGETIYKWHEYKPRGVPGHSYWEWTEYGGDEKLVVNMFSPSLRDVPLEQEIPLNDNSCFLVTWYGTLQFSGSGPGCTPA